MRAHLHGHMHTNGGQWAQSDGRQVVNAATPALLIDWPSVSVTELGF